jgi:hypothetical protein
MPQKFTRPYPPEPKRCAWSVRAAATSPRWPRATGTSSTTVTVSYYNSGTGAAVGTVQTQTLAPNAFWGLYQPTGGLPSGTRATAVITTSSGGQVAMICNESSSSTFMSYDGQ